MSERQVDQEHPEVPETPVRGLGAVLAEQQFSAMDAMGGWRGLIETTVPTLVFIVLYTILHDVRTAAIAAVAVCAAAVLVRVVQRQRVGSAVSGLVGVGIGAVWAIRSGQGTDFYLPGILINAVTFAILLGSILLRRPLVAIIAAVFDPQVADWARDRDAVRTYARATALMAGLYAIKTAVQILLFSTGQVAALGVAKLVLGLPAFALVVWMIWLMHRALVRRRTLRTQHASGDAQA